MFSWSSAPKTLNKDLSSAVGQTRSEKGLEERSRVEVPAREILPVRAEISFTNVICGYQ